MQEDSMGKVSISKKIIFGLLFLIFFEVIILSQGYFENKRYSAHSIEKNATKIYTKCYESESREQCYAREFYELTKKSPVDYSISVLDFLQEIDPRYAIGCHFVAHKISQAEVEKNPDGWEDVLRKVFYDYHPARLLARQYHL